MAHKITVNLPIGKAQAIQELGRKVYGDWSLGFNQAAHVLLDALASGEYELKKVAKRKTSKPKDDTVEVDED